MWSRNYLIHCPVPVGKAVFVTWRLADSVPAHLIEKWSNELATMLRPQRAREMARRIERFSDQGHGSCVLRDPALARIVASHLADHSIGHFALDAWVVMPNHVHVLLTPTSTRSLSDTMNLIKGGSARAINLALGRGGRLWQREYFDRIIRDASHFERVRNYIEWNPVKADLVKVPHHWPWSSACQR